MGNLIPESLVWLDQIENLKGKTRKEWRPELKKVHDLSSSQITNLLSVKVCFDQTAFDKVRQAEKANPSFTLSLNSAMALAGLKGKVSDLASAIHAALDVTLAHRLTTKKIKNLVKWIISGKPASDFDPNKKTTGTQEEKTEEDLSEDQTGTEPTGKTRTWDLKKLRQLLEKAEEERIRGNKTTAQEKLENYIQKIASSLTGSSPNNSSGTSTHLGSQKTDETISETVLLDWIADIDVVKQLKAKRKKGKSLTGKEWGLLIVNKAGEFLGHAMKLFIKLFKPFLRLLHGVWKLVVQALKVLGLYDYAKAIMTILAVIVGIWFAWQAIRYGVMRPVETIWSKIHFHHVAEGSPTPVPTPPPTETSHPDSTLMSLANAAMGHLKPKPTPIPKPVVVYQPSVSFIPNPLSTKTLSPMNRTGTSYDPKLFELEIAAIPKNSIVKDYPMTPDEGIPVDLAVSRMQDLTDADKYTMMIGGSKQIIKTVNATNSTLTINYKSTDPFDGLGGGKDPLIFFWEDLKYIHTNEIDISSPKSGTRQPDIIYQCSLVVSGAKYPLTIQCASSDDLEHLVSTMEFFIRNSRLGRDTALAGMPYPTQGLRLNNDRVVEKLWANSPADKAGLGLGDHLWSVGKVASEQQNRKDLETGLSSYANGNNGPLAQPNLAARLVGSAQVPITVFVASPAEWDKALIARNPNSFNAIHPTLRKVVISL